MVFFCGKKLFESPGMAIRSQASKFQSPEHPVSKPGTPSFKARNTQFQSPKHPVSKPGTLGFKCLKHPVSRPETDKKEDMPFSGHILLTCHPIGGGLYDALCHHGFGHFHEAGHVGALYVVDVAIGFRTVLHAVLMDVLHDGVQAVVHFFGCPRQTL